MSLIIHTFYSIFQQQQHGTHVGRIFLRSHFWRKCSAALAGRSRRCGQRGSAAASGSGQRLGAGILQENWEEAKAYSKGVNENKDN